MFFGIAALVFALWADQFSKYMLAVNLSNGENIPFGDYFSLVKVWNTGVSFSMFNNHGDLGRIVLCVLSLVVCAFLLYWMLKEKNALKVISLGLIIGGALGNVIDRVRFGAVLDFLDFHIAGYHWPAFNLADSFICIGAGVLIVMEFLRKQKKEEEKI
ncbi:MAG: signal peptidase II [Alphaproteobacteria bacterium]|nr:signal peptidase II [Alphaproteobacteria bacterium]